MTCCQATVTSSGWLLSMLLVAVNLVNPQALYLWIAPVSVTISDSNIFICPCGVYRRGGVGPHGCSEDKVHTFWTRIHFQRSDSKVSEIYLLYNFRISKYHFRTLNLIIIHKLRIYIILCRTFGNLHKEQYVIYPYL